MLEDRRASSARADSPSRIEGLCTDLWLKEAEEEESSGPTPRNGVPDVDMEFGE